ncbi:splicing factor C9orf78-like [Zootoca vivipara]|uniref:splicing factor C9orf78-like n=1 Tax=Zootoca vivipara TaxID=8524 RepID=UPI00293C037B|nr:splicing factor C9orf78-like [Zootoca vivipara]
MTPSRLCVSEPTRLVAEPYFSTADRTASSGQQDSIMVQGTKEGIRVRRQRNRGQACRDAFRRRKVDSEDDDDAQVTEEVQLKLEEAKELQSLRRRPNGVGAAALLVGEKLQEETVFEDACFKIKTGGKVDMKKLKERGKARISEEEDLNLGTSFAAETNRRDEDADMSEYIETELKKRTGIVENEEQKVKQKNPEDCLYELPENTQVSSAKKTEEMLSNQMLSGIPEVDLGIEAKIKNIVSTEEATTRLLAEQQNKKKDSKTSFVPMNMAVNYVQHNRFYHEELDAPVRRNKEEPKARPLRVGGTEKPQPERSPPNRKRGSDEKATNDYHYEKFKKMNRRY